MVEDAPTPAEKLLDRWRKWLHPDAPNPTPAPEPEKPVDPSLLKYLQAWHIIKEINFKQLMPLVVTVPALVFFAISGVVAWLGVLCGLFLRVVRWIYGLFRRQ